MSNDETAQPSAPAKPPEASHRRWGWIRDVTIPLIVAAVALLGTWLGSYQATKSSQDAQRAQLHEERLKADREKRSEVYLKFLDAASSYSLEIERRIEKCMGTNKEWVPPESAPAHGKLIECQFGAYQDSSEAKRIFAEAHADVYIYGSDESATVARKVTADFPELTDPGTGIITFSIAYKSDSFHDHYAEFNRMACRELPANPRSQC